MIEEEAGLDIEIFEGDDLHRFAPYLATDLQGASFCPQEGHADPLSPHRCSRSAPSRQAPRSGHTQV